MALTYIRHILIHRYMYIYVCICVRLSAVFNHIAGITLLWLTWHTARCSQFPVASSSPRPRPQLCLAAPTTPTWFDVCQVINNNNNPVRLTLHWTLVPVYVNASSQFMHPCDCTVCVSVCVCMYLMDHCVCLFVCSFVVLMRIWICASCVTYRI